MRRSPLSPFMSTRTRLPPNVPHPHPLPPSIPSIPLPTDSAFRYGITRTTPKAVAVSHHSTQQRRLVPRSSSHSVVFRPGKAKYDTYAELQNTWALIQVIYPYVLTCHLGSYTLFACQTSLIQYSTTRRRPTQRSLQRPQLICVTMEGATRQRITGA